MKKTTISITFITPCLMAGANQKEAELRSASVRGALRWWYRLGKSNCIREENEIFGSVHGANTAGGLIVRTVTSKTNFKTDDALSFDKIIECKTNNRNDPFPDYFLCNVKLDRQQRDNRRGVIAPKSEAEIIFLTRLGRRISPSFSDTLKLFLLLGTVGSRSSRAYGSIWPSASYFDGVSWEAPKTEAEFSRTLKQIIPAGLECTIFKVSETAKDWEKAVNACSSFLRGIRCGSTSFGGKPKKWGLSDHDLPFNGSTVVYRPVLGLPLEQRYRQAKKSFAYHVTEDAFSNDRWSSPLRFKIIPLGQGFMPIAMFFPQLAPNTSVKKLSLMDVTNRRRPNSLRDVHIDRDLLDFFRSGAERPIIAKV